MTIDITKKEYRLLVNLLHMAWWVIYAHRTGAEYKDRRLQKYEKLIQKLYSCFREMDADDLILYDEKHGKHYPTKEMEDDPEVTGIIEKMEDDAFWEMLVDRLSERDLWRREGIEKRGKIAFEEWIDKHEDIAAGYWKEFSAHGLENVDIVKKGKQLVAKARKRQRK